MRSMFPSDHPILHDAVVEIFSGTRSFVKGKYVFMLSTLAVVFLFFPYWSIYLLFVIEVHGKHDGIHCSGTL